MTRLQAKVADQIYGELTAAGVEVMLDDRKERPGVKFKDADLLGIPVRITVGRGAADGMIEYKMRRDADKEEMSAAEGIKKLSTSSTQKNKRDDKGDHYGAAI